MKKTLQLGLMVLAAGIVLASTTPALACWDGYQASRGEVPVDHDAPRPRVVLEKAFVYSSYMDPHLMWSDETARELAQWLPRLEMILPPAVYLSAHGPYATTFVQRDGAQRSHDDLSSERFWSLPQLFYKLAAHYNVPRAQVRQALAVKTRAMTVQVGSYDTPQGARALADQLNEAYLTHGLGDASLSGIYRVGNTAVQPIAYVSKHGERWSVVTGTYLTRADAERMQQALEATFQYKGYVRPL